jgi:hypothetical protein
MNIIKCVPLLSITFLPEYLCYDKYFPLYVPDARRNSDTALCNVLSRTNARAVSRRLLIAAAHIQSQARPC